MTPKKKTFRCGFVSIVGRPNVGKSTLLNYIMGEKIAIVSSVPQTTRHQIRGVYSEERGQIIFMDTPGLHLEKDKLDRIMNTTSLDTVKAADCIVHLVDPMRTVGKEEETVVSRLNKIKSSIILGINKVDLKDKHTSQYIELWKEAKKKNFSNEKSFIMLPVSGKTGFNIDKLVDLIFERLPFGEPLYPVDTLTDYPQKIAISDIIREKLFHAMREELPHSLAVIVHEITPRKKKVVFIAVSVLVERKSQKEIVIGKGGQILKKIGIQARRELETLLSRKVYLDIHVKLQKKWRDSPSILQELGHDL